MLYYHGNIIAKMSKIWAAASQNNAAIPLQERHKKPIINMLVGLTICFLATALPWILSISLTVFSSYYSRLHPKDCQKYKLLITDLSK